MAKKVQPKAQKNAKVVKKATKPVKAAPKKVLAKAPVKGKVAPKKPVLAKKGKLPTKPLPLKKKVVLAKPAPKKIIKPAPLAKGKTPQQKKTLKVAPPAMKSKKLAPSVKASAKVAPVSKNKVQPVAKKNIVVAKEIKNASKLKAKVQTKVPAKAAPVIAPSKNKNVKAAPISKVPPALEPKKNSKKFEEEIVPLKFDTTDEIKVREKVTEEVVGLMENYSVKDILAALNEIDFFKNTSDECREKNCDNVATTLGYCRLHYIKNWKDIKKKEAILKEGRLQQLIEDLVTKYPPNNIMSLINDLADDKSFYSILKELDLDTDVEGFDEADDDAGDDDSDIAFETKTLGKAFVEEED